MYNITTIICQALNHVPHTCRPTNTCIVHVRIINSGQKGPGHLQGKILAVQISVFRLDCPTEPIKTSTQVPEPDSGIHFSGSCIMKNRRYVPARNRGRST